MGTILQGGDVSRGTDEQKISQPGENRKLPNEVVNCYGDYWAKKLKDDTGYKWSSDLLKVVLQPNIKDDELEWIADYSLEQYKTSDKDIEYLDTKAASFAAIVGGGIVALSIGSISGFASAKLPHWLYYTILPSLFAAIASVFYSVLARLTVSYSAPPSVQRMFQNIGAYKEKAKIATIAQLGVAIAIVKYVCREKCRYLDISMWAFFASIALLSIPLISIAISSQSESKPAQIAPLDVNLKFGAGKQ